MSSSHRKHLDEMQQKVPFPPGLESTQGPNAAPYIYKTVSFGAAREYGPEEGWTTIPYRHDRRKRRSSN